MKFVARFEAPGPGGAQALWFAFRDGKILVKAEEGQPRLPSSREAAGLCPDPPWKHYFGELDGAACFAVCLPEDEVAEEAAGDGFEWRNLRELFGQMEDELVWAAGRAGQLVHWHLSHRFCGRCGSATADHRGERAKICPACAAVNHPRVSPAIIVAVVRDRRLLLAHAQRFPAKFYSVLAGFVEPGETLEECVRREVMEETGIEVANIRYFGSQPWPFPDSLMVAFTAEYAGGEIRPNPGEIADAGWFSADALPRIPPRLSIARKLIDWFTEEFGGGNSEGGIGDAEGGRRKAEKKIG
jgi:NAD+ diphosphatase